MAYSDFTLKKIEQDFGLQTIISEKSIFPETIELPEVAPFFLDFLKRTAAAAETVNTEKARSEYIIAPILLYLRELSGGGSIGVFSGTIFDVEPEKGLTSTPDFLLTRGGLTFEVKAPACVIVEAKKEAIYPGIPQCIAELIAVHRFNERENQPLIHYYGAVTTGTNWRFLRYEPKQNSAIIDDGEILFLPLEKLLAVLLYAVQSPKPLITE